MNNTKLAQRTRGCMTCVSIVLLLQASVNSTNSPVPSIQIIPAQLGAQEIVNPLRGNVVRVQRGMKGPQGSINQASATGFGFIVGERNKRLYIVTANHVARRDEKGSRLEENIEVMFYKSNDKWQPATLLERFLPKPQDLAVLEVAAPDGFAWERHCAADVNALISTSRNGNIGGLPAVFIGRQSDSKDFWFIPSVPGSIRGNPNTDSLLSVEITTVMSGTSGAPLVSLAGIIGMIVVDEGGGVAKALSIEQIRTALSEWQYEWSLTSLSGAAQSPKITAIRAGVMPTLSNRNAALLIIGGMGFGGSGARVFVNGKDVSGEISAQDENIIQLRGDQRKLNLIKGTNKVIVRVGGVDSNEYVFTDMLGGVR